LVAVFIVRPKVLVVESNKENVMLLFADIPMNLVTVFHQRASIRWTAQRAAMNGDSVDESTDDVLAELNETEAAFKAAADAELAAAAQLRAAGAHRGDDEEDDDANEMSPLDVSGKVSVELGDIVSAGSSKLSERQKRKLKAVRERIKVNASFILRHLTMLKVCIMVLLTIIYMAVMYQIEFQGIQQRLSVSPAQVNWSQHRRLSLLLLVYDLRHILTQKFWKLYEAGNPDIVDVTESDFFGDLTLLNDIESGLAFGSDRFMVDPPVAGIQEQLMFERDLTCMWSPFFFS
jgi:hypothetical protein